MTHRFLKSNSTLPSNLTVISMNVTTGCMVTMGGGNEYALSCRRERVKDDYPDPKDKV